MGVKSLWIVLSPGGRKIKVESLEGKVLAIDASIWVLQFMFVGSRIGLLNLSGANSHISGFFKRICKLLFYGIKPVFVFDGKTPSLKQRTLRERRDMKERQRVDFKKAAVLLMNNTIKQRKLQLKQEQMKQRRSKSSNGSSSRSSKQKVMQDIQTSLGSQHKLDSEVTAPQTIEDSLAQIALKLEQEEESRVKKESEFLDAQLTENLYEQYSTLFTEFAISQAQFKQLELDAKYQFIDELKKKKIDKDRDALLKHSDDLKEYSKFSIKKFVNEIGQRRENKQKRIELTKKHFRQQGIGARQDADWIKGQRMNKVASEKNTYYQFKKGDLTQQDLVDKLPDMFKSNSRLQGGKFKGRKKRKKTKAQLQLDKYIQSAKVERQKLANDKNRHAQLEKIGINPVDFYTMNPIEAMEQYSKKALEFKQKKPGGCEDEPQGKELKVGALSSMIEVDKGKEEVVGSVGEVVSSDGVMSNEGVKRKFYEMLIQTKPIQEEDSSSSDQDEDLFTTKRSKMDVDMQDSNPIVQLPKRKVSEVKEESKSEVSQESVESSEEVESAVEGGGFFIPEPQQVGDAEWVKQGEDLLNKHLSPKNKPSDNFDFNASLPSQQAPPQDQSKPPSLFQKYQIQREENQKLTDVLIQPMDEQVDDPPESEVRLEQEGDDDYMMDDIPDEMFNDIEYDGFNLDQQTSALKEEQQTLIKQMQKVSGGFGHFSEEIMEDIRDLLDAFGIPYVHAPFEAEAQCAWLEQKGLVDGVVTEDSDVFLFGARKVYKNIFTKKSFVQFYDMAQVERQMGLTRDNLIQMALFMGSDYTLGVKGIGPVNAVEIISEFPDMEQLMAYKKWANESLLEESIQPRGRKKFISETKKAAGGIEEEHKGDTDNYGNWARFNLAHEKEVVAEYQNPKVDTDTTKFKWVQPNYDQLRRVARLKVGWDQMTVTNFLDQAIKRRPDGWKSITTQRKLDDYFYQQTKFAKFKSVRIIKAVDTLKSRIAQGKK